MDDDEFFDDGTAENEDGVSPREVRVIDYFLHPVAVKHPSRVLKFYSEISLFINDRCSHYISTFNHQQDVICITITI